MFEIRSIEETEYSFLLRMLYESIYIEAKNKPAMKQLLSTDSWKKYYVDWGRQGDKALIAIDADRIPCGAVWYRLFNNNEHGYGFVNDCTPELGIAIEQNCRGMGLGKRLMCAIMLDAKNNGFEALSLSVDAKNTNAVKLYHKLGFEEVDRDDTSYIMIKKL